MMRAHNSLRGPRAPRRRRTKEDTDEAPPGSRIRPVSRSDEGFPVAAQKPHDGKVFHLVEATIADIEHALASDLLEPEQLVQMYLARIAAFDQAGPHLNSYMYVNPHAVDAARAL